MKTLEEMCAYEQALLLTEEQDAMNALQMELFQIEEGMTAV